MGQGMKILIVDDSDTVRKQVRAALEGAGFTVVESCDGEEGLVNAKSHPDARLMISDVIMPRMDGMTMVERVRDIPELKALPVFMLTTETDAALKERGKNAGVRAWMIKPLSPEKMVIGVKKLLGSA